MGDSGTGAFLWTFSAQQRIRENCERGEVYITVDFVLNDFLSYSEKKKKKKKTFNSYNT